MHRTLAILGVAVLCGCSTAGPYVTNISSNGDGTITVEKNTVKFDGFSGAVSQGDKVTTQVIRICPVGAH